MEMHRDGSSVHPWPLSLCSDFGSTTLDVLAEGEKRKLRSSRGAELSPLRRDTRSGLRVLFLSVLFPAVGAREYQIVSFGVKLVRRPNWHTWSSRTAGRTARACWP
jgi:hypothetical protein